MSEDRKRSRSDTRDKEKNDVDQDEDLKQVLSSGAYIPPFKLARLMQGKETMDKSSEEFQRLSWEALKVVNIDL